MHIGNLHKSQGRADSGFLHAKICKANLKAKGKREMKQAVYPCRGCKYFKTCGSYTRTQACKGRELKSAKGKEVRK